jgi:integrase
MDLDDFRAWGLADYGLRPETSKAQLRRVRRMAKLGVDWGRFATSPQIAREEARRYLAALAVQGGSEASRNYVQTFNLVARYLEATDERFKGVHWDYPKKQRASLQRYTRDQLRALADYRHPQGVDVIEKRRRALLWVAWATGLRRGEIGDLRVSDLDPVRGTLKVRKPRKDGKRRLIPLPEDAWSPKRPLQAWLKVRPPAPDGDWLWTSPMGRMNGDCLYNDDFWYIAQEVGFPVDFRRFRHNRGKALAKALVPLQVIQEALGHSSPNSTRVYMEELEPEEMAEAFRKHRVPGYAASNRSKRIKRSTSESAGVK